MRVRRLEIERFRGIRSLDWRHIGDTVALVGPGDSGKSTVLDALERVLSPRWNFPFDDADFFGATTENAIRIAVTIVDFPAAFSKETRFGLALCAFDSETGTAVPPTGATNETFALVLELKVDGSLEPQWNVIDATGEEHPAHAKDRESLGMLRVGGTIDLHLGWSRGSVLTRLTETGDDVSAAIADAMRKARAGLAVKDLDRLAGAAQKVEKLGRDMGASLRTGLVPHLDVAALTHSGGSLSLHDGDVPLRRAGLGTRRLFTVAMQQGAAGSSGLALVDEFEHGLEPHRIRQLLRKLRGVAPENADSKTGQLMLTTHSPVVLAELEPTEIVVVARSGDGAVRLAQVPEALRRVHSKAPEALVARRVIVAEGPTEVGLLRALETEWAKEGANFAYHGTAVVNGMGSNAPAIAGSLRDLGYATALFIDMDTPKPGLGRAKGATILAWRAGTATENVLSRDLSEEGLAGMVALAHRSPDIQQPAQRPMRDALASAAGKKPAEIGDDLEAWNAAMPEFRAVFGKVAKKNGWFKSLAMGHGLGCLVVSDWDALAGKETGTLLSSLREFAERG